MKIKKNEKRIKKFLINKPHLRDDDMKLLVSVWWDEITFMGKDPNNMSAFELMKKIADNKLANPSSIRRCRAKLQEVNPELRGSKYNDRKNNQTNEVKNELKNW